MSSYTEIYMRSTALDILYQTAKFQIMELLNDELNQNYLDTLVVATYELAEEIHEYDDFMNFISD